MIMSDKIYYFCYGSNLWSKRREINVKSGVKYGNGFINDYKLTFSGTGAYGFKGSGSTEDSFGGWKGGSADIIPQTNSIVWGLVLTISDDDLKGLDVQEVGYERISIEVTIEGSDEVVKCVTYVQSNEFKSKSIGADCKPSLTYKTVILKGAVEQRLPEEYIEFLKSIEDNGVLNSEPQSLKI